MKKANISLVKLISRALLAVILVISIAQPAFAAKPPFSAGTDATNPAMAAITKVFMIPVNTTTPEAVFKFIFTPVGVNGGNVTAGMPDLGVGGAITVSFTKGQTATFTENGTNYLVDQSVDILEKLPKDGSPWVAGAGIYKYTVKEEGSGIVLSGGQDVKEFESYSKAVYEIEIWVEEDASGVLFPMYIVGYYIEATPDEYYDGMPGECKLDPTPGGTKPGTPAEIGERHSQIIFTNKYWKTDGPISTDPDKNALEVTKQVTGNNPDLDTYFSFSITVTTPYVVGTPNKTYNAYIVDKAGKYVAISGVNPNIPDGTNANLAADYITFTSGAARTVMLKHGERLVFFDLEVGAKVMANETIVGNSRVKYNNTFGPYAGIDFIMPLGTTGTWGFPRDMGTTPDVGPHYTKEGAGANVSTFFNNMTGNPPTGISVDDLPFLVLICAAITGFAVFVIVRVRKVNKNSTMDD